MDDQTEGQTSDDWMFGQMDRRCSARQMFCQKSKITTIYREPIDENDLKTSQKDIP